MLETAFVSYVVLCGSTQQALSDYITSYIKRHEKNYRVELVGGVSVSLTYFNGGLQYCQALARYEKK